jgi:hypothetical protein
MAGESCLGEGARAVEVEEEKAKHYWALEIQGLLGVRTAFWRVEPKGRVYAAVPSCTHSPSWPSTLAQETRLRLSGI